MQSTKVAIGNVRKKMAERILEASEIPPAEGVCVAPTCAAAVPSRGCCTTLPYGTEECQQGETVPYVRVVQNRSSRGRPI
ncbi:UNVERIFIED_CONTAM: hypothetical protein FKN15_067171 [Acipenser sinensis]